MFAAVLVAATGCSSDRNRSRTPSSTTTPPPSQAVVHDPVAVTGAALVDGAPFDSKYVGAVVLNDGLVTPCQAALPPVTQGRYSVSVLDASASSGCGTQGARVALWTFAHDQILYSTNTFAWPADRRVRTIRRALLDGETDRSRSRARAVQRRRVRRRVTNRSRQERASTRTSATRGAAPRRCARRLTSPATSSRPSDPTRWRVAPRRHAHVPHRRPARGPNRARRTPRRASASRSTSSLPRSRRLGAGAQGCDAFAFAVVERAGAADHAEDQRHARPAHLGAVAGRPVDVGGRQLQALDALLRPQRRAGLLVRARPASRGARPDGRPSRRAGRRMSSPCTITSPSATYAGPGGLRVLVMISSKRPFTSAGVPAVVAAAGRLRRTCRS